MGSRIQGSVENVVDGRVLGWVRDLEDPGRSLDVEVLVDEEPVASGVADIERPVLAAAGIGDGRCAFDVTLPERLTGTRSHSIRVVAGPERAEVPVFHAFQSATRLAGSAWEGVDFVPAAPGERPFDPPPEPAVDPGEAALVGERGWLFTLDAENLSLEQLRGAPLITEAQVERRSLEIAERTSWLRARRIPYLLAVAPLKERVYRRFLPAEAALHPERPVAAVDRALRERSPYEVFDLLPALRDAQRSGRAFPRTDSGWSDLGAFFVYRELMREAAKRVITLPDPLRPDEVTMRRREDYRGDLAGKPRVHLMGEGLVVAGNGAETPSASEEIDVADVSGLRALRMPAPAHLEVTPGRAPRLYESADPSLPRAVLVGDSLALKLIPWLAEHFSRLVFLWADEPPLEAVELEAPDILIHVVPERLLLREP